MLEERRRQQKLVGRMQSSSSGLLRAWNQLVSVREATLRMARFARRLRATGIVRAINQ